MASHPLPSPVVSVAFSPDGRLVATGGRDGRARIWPLGNLNAPPIVLRGHKDSIRSVAFSSDGRLVATGGEDGTARLCVLDEDVFAGIRIGVAPLFRPWPIHGPQEGDPDSWNHEQASGRAVVRLGLRQLVPQCWPLGPPRATPAR